MKTKLRILLIDTIIFGVVGAALGSAGIFLEAPQLWIIFGALVVLKVNN